jgi:2-methylcitrate dehydratase PrpD
VVPWRRRFGRAHRELTLAQFEPARYDDPTLRRFAERGKVRAERKLRGVAADVEIETANGKSFSAHCDPLGAPENRLSRTQIEAKFRTYAAGRLAEARIEEAIAEVARLEHKASVRTLMDMLRSPPQNVLGAPAPVASVARA